MKFTKACNKTTQILMVVASLAALVLFFLTFATVTSSDGHTLNLAGSQLAWKGDVELANGNSVGLPRSTDIWFCFILAVLGLVFSALTFKYKGMRYAAPAFTLGSGIYMLVVACSNPVKFVDIHTIDHIYPWSSLEYGFAVWGVTIALLAAAVFGVAHLLLDDYVMVNETKSAKYTIPQRVVRFIKDYKSEVKKIVWPTRKTVFKNTGIVLAIFLIIGIFIWVVDFGLAKLLELIF